MSRVAVVVPTYNEADNLPVLAEKLLGLPTRVELVVVDDASPDGTGQLADALASESDRIHVIHRTGPRGYAPASTEGLTRCLAEGFDIICTMDADLSHDPAVLPELVARVENDADMAIGSRYVPGGELVVDWSPVRRAVSKAGSTYARLMMGSGVRDCTSGFRCYQRSLLERVPFEDLRSDGYSFLIEVLSAAVSSGARVAEVPITYVDRRQGVSKISRRIVIEALFLTTGIGLSRLFGRRRRLRDA